MTRTGNQIAGFAILTGVLVGALEAVGGAAEAGGIVMRRRRLVSKALLAVQAMAGVIGRAVIAGEVAYLAGPIILNGVVFHAGDAD